MEALWVIWGIYWAVPIKKQLPYQENLYEKLSQLSLVR